MKNQLKSILLLGVLTAIVVGVGTLLAPGYAGLLGGLALLANLLAYFFSDRLVLRLHRARDLSPAEAPALHHMVGELAVAARIPKPRVYLIPDPQPNAFATGRNPRRGAVAVTEGILGQLDALELRGVLAHEIAHIKNRDILLSSIAAALASAVTWLAHALSLSSLFGGARDADEEGGSSGLSSFALAAVAPLAAALVQLGISRSREYLADEIGARLCGDPESLARALLKLERAAQVVPAAAPQPATASLFIVNPFAGAASLLRLFSTHPPIEERVRRLRAMTYGTRGLRRPAAATWLWQG